MKMLILWTALLLPVHAAAAQMTLREAIDTAERENPEVLSARLKALEVEILAAARRAALCPSLDIQAAASYQTSNLQGIGLVFPGYPSRVGPYRVFDARPRLQQTLVDLSLWASVRANRLRARASKEEAEAAIEGIRFAVVDLYLQALAADSRRRAAEARVESASALAAQTAEHEKEGTASRLENARALEQLERETTAVILARRDLEVARSLLARVLGTEPASLPELREPGVPAAQLKSVPVEEALERRPEARASALRLSALESDLVFARRERLPKLTAAVDFGITGQHPANGLSTYTVGVQLTIPLWTGGRIEKSIALARNRLRQQEEEGRRLRLVIVQEIAQAGIERDAATWALEAASRASDAARESLELARLRYSAGLATQLDVVTAQANLAQAEEDQIRLRYDSWLAGVRLARASGSVRLFLRNRE
jgi:outer membrane protein